MITIDSALQLIQSHGLWLLAPVAVLEGPIITVVAAYLAKLGYMPLGGVYLVCVLGDLIGDAALYWLGRSGPRFLPGRWQVKLGITRARKVALEEHFAAKGGRTLLFGKWTHSVGMPILLASGAAKMPFGPYMLYNLLGTLPKTLLFTAVGYFIGHAYTLIDTYIYRASIIGFVVVGMVGFWFWRRRHKTS